MNSPILLPLTFLTLANFLLSYILSKIPIVNDLLEQNEPAFIFVALIFNLVALFYLFKLYSKRK